jgi:hypothetical protein
MVTAVGEKALAAEAKAWAVLEAAMAAMVAMVAVGPMKETRANLKPLLPKPKPKHRPKHKLRLKLKPPRKPRQTGRQ